MTTPAHRGDVLAVLLVMASVAAGCAPRAAAPAPDREPAGPAAAVASREVVLRVAGLG